MIIDQTLYEILNRGVVLKTKDGTTLRIITKDGLSSYVMSAGRGPNSRTHSLDLDSTDQTRLNAHWNGFHGGRLFPPSRRVGALVLSLTEEGPFVVRFGYSASLACAANEGVLHSNKSRNREEEYELSVSEQKIVDEWEIVYGG